MALFHMTYYDIRVNALYCFSCDGGVVPPITRRENKMSILIKISLRLRRIRFSLQLLLMP